jgi:hypothetical protein
MLRAHMFSTFNDFYLKFNELVKENNCMVVNNRDKQVCYHKITQSKDFMVTKNAGITIIKIIISTIGITHLVKNTLIYK